MTRDEAIRLARRINARWAVGMTAQTGTVWADHLEPLDHDLATHAIADLERTSKVLPTIPDLHNAYLGQRRRHEALTGPSRDTTPRARPDIAKAALAEARALLAPHVRYQPSLRRGEPR